MDDALEIVRKRYNENKTLYKKLYGFDFGDDLSVFNEIINTDDLGPQQVLVQAINAVKKYYDSQTTKRS
jgi:cytidylate kinase